MPGVELLVHIPRLRIEPASFEVVPGAELVQVGPDWYDAVTRRAYTDWLPRLEASQPVFLRVEATAEGFVGPGEATGFLEEKLPTGTIGPFATALTGSPVVEQFLDLADVVWAALVLAVPGAAPGHPRSSVSFVVPFDGDVCVVADHTVRLLRVQGDADQENLFAPDLAGAPLGEAELERAAELLPLVAKIASDERLGPGLRALLATTDAATSRADRLVLAVSALESVLLPEVRDGLQDAFVRRTSALLGAGVAARARDLYRARSRAVHDGPDTLDPASFTPGIAEQLLADVLLAEAGHAPAGGDGLRGRSRPDRLHPRGPWYSGTSGSGNDLSSPEGTLVSWAPLVGLRGEIEDVALGQGFGLTTMTASDIVSMEEKDIRRDFVGRLRVWPAELGPDAHGCVVSLVAHDGGPPSDEQLRLLLDARDRAVAVLRLAGLHRFVDAELAGWFVYDGHLRHRHETVFRQTVLLGLPTSEHDELTPEAVARAVAVAGELAGCGSAADPELVAALDAYRRAHSPFLPAAARGVLLFALLEALLGRFRPKSAAPTLEQLVGVLGDLDPARARWFAKHGRRCRNGTAHGGVQLTDDDPALGHLLAICAAALREEIGRRGVGAPSLAAHLRARLA